jgi:hypothetical protein
VSLTRWAEHKSIISHDVVGIHGTIQNNFDDLQLIQFKGPTSQAWFLVAAAALETAKTASATLRPHFLYAIIATNLLNVEAFPMSSLSQKCCIKEFMPAMHGTSQVMNASY